MKKNRMMRLASLLLVLVLMTSSVVGGTFAKYTVTGPEEKDSARVAKWGVEIVGATDKTTFSKTYAIEDTVLGAGLSLAVENKGDEKLVAPGTAGTMAEVTIKGTPEVAVSVTYDAEVTLTGWSITGGEYCPLVFTVKNGDGAAQEIKMTGTVADFEAAVEAAIEGCKETYEPNTNLEAETATDVVVKWEWPFVGDDTKDTELGNLAVAPTVEIKVTTTVEQIN